MDNSRTEFVYTGAGATANYVIKAKTLLSTIQRSLAVAAVAGTVSWAVSEHYDPIGTEEGDQKISVNREYRGPYGLNSERLQGIWQFSKSHLLEPDFSEWACDFTPYMGYFGLLLENCGIWYRRPQAGIYQ